MFHSSPLRLPVLLILAALPLLAQRDPVLKQIDLPHRYYYREMYLPQLTTGPSSAVWLPDSRSLVYSMAGSLWKQSLGLNDARQLTAGPGYDYQPDCSPDGKWVVYAKYDHDAIELWALSLETGQTKQLTSGGAVNVEPRFSPDGSRLAFVSTSYNGRFHIFAGNFHDAELRNVQRLTGETRTSKPRFYYSEYDHEISPVWSADGKELIFICNHDHVYGTGGFWRMKAEPGAEANEFYSEETTWKARPEISPDGKRMVYASYLGRQWHQLWVMPTNGGDAFPLSYGDFDNLNPRWSPDGKNIAFISNRDGNTSLWIQEAVGGKQVQVVATRKHYLKPTGQLTITVLDSAGKPTPARLFVTGQDGLAYAPDDAWMHAEDNFDRSERRFEAHYFHSRGIAKLTVPAERVDVEVMKGFEYKVEKKSVQVAANGSSRLTIHLQPFNVPSDSHSRWASADLHVHMNYGGSYRNTPANLAAQESAENLSLIANLIVNKEQRIPDIAYFRTSPDPVSTPDHWLLHSQEFHTSYWGHLGLLNLTQNFLIPGYATYANTAAASLYPSNADIADRAHAQTGLVGYAHPFDIEMDPINEPTLTHGQPLDEALELPVDVALGKVDYLEVMGFSDHRLTAAIWYRLLNLGFRLPAGAGSDTMANYASLHGPVGLARVYARAPLGAIKPQAWFESLKHGRTFVSNGPLLGFELSGKEAGDDLKLPSGDKSVPFKAWMRSNVPVDHVELVCDGKVVRALTLSSDRQSANAVGTIPVPHSGWCLLRASSDKPEHPILDDYVYASTGPIYISVAGSAPKSPEDAAFFIAWIDRLIEHAKADQAWNNEDEKASVMKTLQHARDIYEHLQ